MTETKFSKIIALFICLVITPILFAQTNYSIDTIKIGLMPKKFKSISGIVSDTANQQVWVGTNVGLYNSKIKNYVFKDYVIFIILDKYGSVWAVTDGDTITCVSKEGNIGSKFHFLQGQTQIKSANITSISTYNDFIFIGTANNIVLRFPCSSATATSNTIVADLIQCNVSSPSSIYAQKPEKDEDYSIIVCGSDGLYIGTTNKDKWNLKKVSEDIHIPDRPIKILPSNQNKDSLKLYFWLMGWNGYSSVAGKLVVSTHSNKTLFLQSDCLKRTAYQPYNFALTKSEDLWIATANGLVYYTLHAKCDSILHDQDTCVVQGRREINKKNDPKFPLNIVRHIALQNDSTIWFASNADYIYKLTLKRDTIGTQSNKVSPDKEKSVFFFNFNAYVKGKKTHTKFPNNSTTANVTSKKIAIKYKKSIRLALQNNDGIEGNNFEVHLLAFASKPPDGTSETAEDIAKKDSIVANDRVAKMIKFLNIPKKQIKKHVIIRYLPPEKGGPQNPETVKVIITCTCKEFEIKEDKD